MATFEKPRDIFDDFMNAYLEALPEGFAKDQSSFNYRLGAAIAKGLEAALNAQAAKQQFPKRLRDN